MSRRAAVAAALAAMALAVGVGVAAQSARHADRALDRASGTGTGASRASAPAQASAPVAAAAPPVATASAPSLVERGRYLATAGDCVACHTRDGGTPFAGGRPIATPFGTVLSANLTPDASGLGDWSADAFYRALHEGVSADGSHLYPAFPYTYTAKMPRADTDAIYAYLRTLAPVANRLDRNQLPFPYNIRGLMVFWNALYLDKTTFAPDPAHDAAWNRGAYLVEGPAHCGACHTPRNALGGSRKGHAFEGARLGTWFAPDITPNTRSGIGGWSRDEVVEFLRTGRNAHASASGEMGLVVADSTSRLTEDDRRAIVVYLADRVGSTTPAITPPAPDVMKVGEAIFVDACSACHRDRGQGQALAFPPLEHSANLQQSDATTTLRFILAGARTQPTDARPTPFAMPAFAWKLDDAQVAAVATYARNAWGNAAPAVRPGDVAALRTQLTFDRPPKPKPTAPTHPGPATLGQADTDSRDNGTPQAGRAASAP